jgi:hypothetical protein
MAVTSREINSQRRLRVDLHAPLEGLRRLAYLITGALALVALYVLLSNAFGWGRVLLDDLHYGRPRTFHLAADVGHAAPGLPSHLIALNLDRQVVVLDIPGGDMEQVRVLPGPYLFGAGEDLTPVMLQLEDMNRDGTDDLVVQVKNEEIIYLNRDGGFVPMSAEERQQVLQLQGEAQ